MDKLVYIGNSSYLKPVAKYLEEYGFETWLETGTAKDKEMLARCWAIVPGRWILNEEVLQQCPNLKIICKTGVGLDRIDIPACTAHGVCVSNTPLSNATSVAEHAMMLMLAVAKQLYPISLYIRRDYPDLNTSTRYRGLELNGKTLAVIGVGNIGSRVVKLAHAFNMNIIGVDPAVDRTKLPDYIEWSDSMDAILPRADFVTVHVSGIAENRGLIGEKQFDLMKESAIFVNTSRGFVVDEDALYRALVNKSIAGAGLDVFAVEPLKTGNPIMRLENFVATPHNAANTPEARNRGMEECARIIKEYAEGKRPDSAANDVPMG